MVKDDKMSELGGIKFFGQMTASATHEIKNTLAIINESAGLLHDLSMMAQKGHPLSLERIKDISQRVTRQVKKTDLVLQKLNRFSHSVDQAKAIVDLEKTLMFVLDLVSRLVQMKEVTIEVIAPLSPLRVDTNLFYLENMIWRAIETACHAAEGEKKIIISFGPDTETPLVRFLMDAAKQELMDDLFGSKEDQALAAYLDISIEKNIDNKGFGLLWPKRI